MTQCNLIVTPKDSDLRFFLRLFASWGLFLLFWSVLIICSVSGVIGICMLVGHHFNNMTGIANEGGRGRIHSTFGTHDFQFMALDTCIGVLCIITFILICGVLFLICYDLKYRQYDPWYKAELKFLQEQINQKEDLLIPEFSELDSFIKGEAKDFWHTIPEYLKFKYYYDKVCPRGSFQRYLSWMSFHTTIDLILLFLAAIVIRYIGFAILPNRVFIDSRTGLEVGAVSKSIIAFGLSLIIISVIILVIIVLYYTVILSCLNEWKIHQTKKKAAITKFD